MDKVGCGSNCSDVSTIDGTSVSHVYSGDLLNDSPSKGQSLIIFDWDDTLFPSTMFVNLGYFDFDVVPEQILHVSHVIAQSIVRLLLIAKSYGHVIIITNAAENWVYECCSRFMPGFPNLLKDIDVISARDRWYHMTTWPTQWKINTFQEVTRSFLLSNPPSHDSRVSVTSLGDAEHERVAVLSLPSNLCFPDLLVKSVKLKANPSVQDLLDQHAVLVGRFPSFAASTKNVDLAITETVSPVVSRRSSFGDSPCSTPTSKNGLKYSDALNTMPSYKKISSHQQHDYDKTQKNLSPPLVQDNCKETNEHFVNRAKIEDYSNEDGFIESYANDGDDGVDTIASSPQSSSSASTFDVASPFSCMIPPSSPSFPTPATSPCSLPATPPPKKGKLIEGSLKSVHLPVASLCSAQATFSACQIGPVSKSVNVEGVMINVPNRVLINSPADAV